MNISFGHRSLFPENEEISAPPPCGLLIGIYLFYENWSTETFRKTQIALLICDCNIDFSKIREQNVLGRTDHEA